MLTIKLFLVPTFIALIAVSGRLWGSAVAGLLSGLPVIAGPIVWFLYLENGLDFARGAAVATVGGIVALSSFCFAYSWLCSRFNWKVALPLSSAIYFVIAISVGKAAMGLHESALLSIAVILLQMYLSPGLENEPLLAPASAEEIICRMAFAFVLVILVTQYAVVLGKTYSGIFAAFPIAGSTIAIFSHRNYSSNHAIRSLKSMKQGLLSMLAFFYVVSVYSGSIGFPLAILFAAVVALLLQTIIIFLRRNYNE